MLQSSTPPWRGFHHIALATPDLGATIEFYRDVLGMQVGDVYPALPGGNRHCFIRPGESETWGIHFFEAPDAQIFPYPEPPPRNYFLPGAFQHLAFALPDEAAGGALRERLAGLGIATTEIGRIGPICNTLFKDNNGLLLEATWPRPPVPEDA